ncbi:TldD/PmbA family protein [Pelagerythrobacter marinus]|uniref:TldD/PmbA family protein n=1 Tax=Pelagerythrobacter marinus TaxID=538382 RepID=UPI00203733AF|nr:metallopeptidase TldD-related protein [Pelagerythrobacter marinus]USA38846.1 metallopeptidase TldD-related protein [Pelagerythrobacter marinus]WPZ07076.1 metallopeptidase TldD-related protein [Pelagerythrobacter marinus]
MIDGATALDRCASLIEAARRHGADAADAAARAQSSEAVGVRLGKLEEVERSEGEGIALRVFVGRRSASIETSDFTPGALDDLAARAVAMARVAPDDPHAGLAPGDRLDRGEAPPLDLEDPARPGPDDLRRRAEAAEDAARAVEGVTNSEGASASCGRSLFALVTSHGFARAYGATHHSVSAVAIGGSGAGMQRDYAQRSARHLEDLPPPEEIGRLAGERTVARLHPEVPRGGRMPVLFDPRVGASLIGHLVGAMAGPAIASRSSFLLGREGSAVFPAAIDVLEDPHRPRGLRSRPFDGEGLSCVPRKLVDRGVPGDWLLNVASASKLGLAPTGHASRGAGAPGVSASNLHVPAGPVGRAELMADIGEGVLVTELAGQGVNAVTGDYSRGASGFRIVGGEIAGPVAEFTVAGNLLAMYARMHAANDLEMHRAINVPTLRVDGMTVAGA